MSCLGSGKDLCLGWKEYLVKVGDGGHSLKKPVLTVVLETNSNLPYPISWWVMKYNHTDCLPLQTLSCRVLHTFYDQSRSLSLEHGRMMCPDVCWKDWCCGFLRTTGHRQTLVLYDKNIKLLPPLLLRDNHHCSLCYNGSCKIFPQIKAECQNMAEAWSPFSSF